MTDAWNRTGALPASTPLASAIWNGVPVVTTGAAVLKLDGGVWNRLGEHLPGVSSLTVTDDGALLAGGHFGVHRWDDGETRWMPLVALLNVSALAVDDGRLFAATEADGVFVSDDGGTSWRACSIGLADQRVAALTATDDGLLLATPTGAYELLSGTDRWRSSDRGLDGQATGGLALPSLPTSPLGELRATQHGLLWSSRDGTAYRSGDDGITWTRELAPADRVPTIEGLPADVRELHEGAYGAVAVVERSRPLDRWTAVLRAPHREGPWVPVLTTTGTAPVVVAEHGGTLVVAIGHRVLRDRLLVGSRPEAIGQLPDPTAIVLALAASEDEVLAATANGVWRSPDGGSTWEQAMVSEVPIIAICAGPRRVAVDADGTIFTSSTRKAA